jgi:folate-dependent phosphoribosylglycinamide formyltransferase PurN
MWGFAGCLKYQTKYCGAKVTEFDKNKNMRNKNIIPIFVKILKMKKLRAAILCSNDSTALQALLEQLDSLPITIELVIHNHPLDSRVSKGKENGTHCLEYNPKRYNLISQYESEIRETLLMSEIDVVIIVDWDKPFQTNLIYNYFTDKVIEIVSPLNQYQYSGSQTAKQSLDCRHVCTCIILNFGRRESTYKLCLELQIPVFVDTDNLETLTSRIQANEKIAILAGIQSAFQNYWQ